MWNALLKAYLPANFILFLDRVRIALVAQAHLFTSCNLESLISSVRTAFLTVDGFGALVMRLIVDNGYLIQTVLLMMSSYTSTDYWMVGYELAKIITLVLNFNVN